MNYETVGICVSYDHDKAIKIVTLLLNKSIKWLVLHFVRVMDLMEMKPDLDDCIFLMIYWSAPKL